MTDTADQSGFQPTDQTDLRLTRRNFWLLWCGMFCTMMAGNFLLVSLSLKTYAATNSAFAAGLFFVAQFVAPLLASGLTEFLCRRLAPRHAMLLADGVSFLAVLGIGFVGDQVLWMVFALLLLRGAGDALLKSARAMAIKTAFPPEVLERSNALLAAPHFIGNGLGVLLAAYLVERLAFHQLGLIAAALIAVSLLCYWVMRLEDTPPEQTDAKTRIWGRVSAAFRDNPALLRAFIQASSLAVFLQGIHQVTRTTVPMEAYGLDPSNAGLFQLAAVLGIITGTYLVAQLRLVRERTSVFSYVLISSGALVLLWLLPAPLMGAAAYFVFMCAFEVGYIRSQSAMMLHADRAALATVMVLSYVVAYSGMAAVILVAGLLTDLIGGLSVSVLVAALTVVINLAALAYLRRGSGVR